VEDLVDYTTGTRLFNKHLDKAAGEETVALLLLWVELYNFEQLMEHLRPYYSLIINTILKHLSCKKVLIKYMR